ncbi:MAG: LuxR C-terminal-related transcriptional regulator [Thermomicrobiales bacterium]
MSTPRARREAASPLIGFPAAQTTFVGRGSDIGALRALLLDPRQRLVSVLGPGGVGKTRLVIASAEGVGSDFPDGVVFVPLSGLSAPRQIPDAVATALAVRGQPDRPILDSVVAALANARLLLVLDNLEHLMGPELRELVSRLIDDCPGVTVLATSREPLHLGLEQRVGVGPLTVPANGESAETIARMDGVQLFVARARAVAPAFTPNPPEMRTIGEICRRVDGLPLAIELAAAWMRMLSPAALLGQLNERLPLLTGGHADQPARFRTMRDAIAWSYDRLPPDEAALLRRLSVFRGGFSLEAAAWLDGGNADQSSSSTLHQLASLCDKHLLFRTDAVGEIQRFGMLETIREFALEQLGSGEELVSAREAHAFFYCDLVERIEPTLLGRHEQLWFALYTAEESNLREAILWGIEKDARVALRLLGASWGHWSWRAVDEGLRLARVALALTDPGPPLVRARALRTATALANLMGDYQLSSTLAREGASYIGRVDDPWLEGELYWNCGCSLLLTGKLVQAAEEFDLALARMESPRSASERAIRAYARSHRGMVDYLLGDNESGAARYAQSVRELQEIEGVALNIIVLSDAANWLLLDEQTSAAQPLLQEALQIAADAHSPWLVISPLSGLALIDAMTGNARRAARRVGAISTMAKRADLVIPPNFQRSLDRAADLAREILGEAAFQIEEEGGRGNPVPVLRDAFSDASTGSGVTGLNGLSSSAGMTPRQREVLGLIVAGYTDRDIAAALFISERTASKHVSTILQKLNAVSRADAAVRAVRLGLV